jgi:bifunctional non-homologous end joining protein LigD
VRPELRCIVRFVEWTPDRRLRAPVFAGLVEEDRGGARARPAPVIDRSRPDAVVAVGDREVRLTNLGKPYWPGEGITKGDLLDHYARVAGVLVPHLAGRPQILKRWPDGIEAQPFFQHQMPRPAPSWLSRVTLTKTESSREEITYAVVDDPASLLWVANLGCVDLNPWCSLAHAPNEPTHALYDHDPAEGVGFDAVVEVALMVAEELDRLGLRGWPKTSGSRGIHILVPVGPGLSHDVTRLFATAVGERLAERRPDLVTMSRRVADRGARVYADPGQNGRGKSVASVWSVRPRARAPVSTPLRWDEVRPGLDPRELDLSEAARRVAADEDPFASLLTSPQPLRQAAERLVSPG